MRFDRLVVLDSVIFFPEHRKRLEELATTVEEYNTCIGEEQVSERCRGADAVISCWVDVPRRVIDENPQLKAVGFWTHDFEHRIDAEYAKAHGVYVPAIPDYGTDSVAELVFLGLLGLLRNDLDSDAEPEEEIVFRIGDDLRRLSANVKDTLAGRWLHEYVKTGKLRIDQPDAIPEETLKGLTVGVLGPDILTPRLVDLLARGLRMNVVYALADAPHTLETAFRPVEALLAESHVIIHDSRRTPPDVLEKIAGHPPRSVVDVAQMEARRTPLRGKRLGVLGLGRIGSRVAQIAVEGFGMEVSYHSRTRKPELEQRLGLRYVELDELLTTCDVISLHLPHHGAEDAVTREHVDRIPAGSVLVNCSVGSVIADEDHLLDRCERGELRAMLDVYRTLPPKERLRTAKDRVLATYRLGWRTKATVGLKTHKLLTKFENATG
ncbi:MAG: NAD(P)-dependent oxidoreductase [Kibdelosporangium sp.]